MLVVRDANASPGAGAGVLAKGLVAEVRVLPYFNESRRAASCDKYPNEDTSRSSNWKE